MKSEILEHKDPTGAVNGHSIRLIDGEYKKAFSVRKCQLVLKGIKEITAFVKKYGKK